MDLPMPVLIHNELMGLRGTAGSLLQVHPDGYYVVTATFGSKLHRVLLPIQQTILIFEEPEESAVETIEVER